MPIALELTGQTVGYLTVLRCVGVRYGSRMWECRCECGKLITLRASQAQSRFIRSCGCKSNHEQHGMAGHQVYGVWSSMRARCRNPKSVGWKNYGGRGISTCARWEKFKNFWEDMGTAHIPGLTIERINNDGNYEPSNCRWATPTEQGLNKRNNVLIPTPWGRITVAEAARRSGIARHKIYGRIKMGWPTSRIFQDARKGIA